jgi:hypothetical protein
MAYPPHDADEGTADIDGPWLAGGRLGESESSACGNAGEITAVLSALLGEAGRGAAMPSPPGSVDLMSVSPSSAGPASTFPSVTPSGQLALDGFASSDAGVAVRRS